MNSSFPPPPADPTDKRSGAPSADSSGPFLPASKLEVRGRRVFFRCDESLLTPARSRGRACPEEGARSTLRQLLEQEASVIVGPSLPKNTSSGDIESFGAALSELLQVEVLLPDEPLGEALRMVLSELRSGQLCLLPNLNASAAEQQEDEVFLRGLSSHADLYVSEAFSDAHLRRGTSCRLPHLLRPAAAGAQLQAELQVLQAFRKTSSEARALILGGADFARRGDFLDTWLENVRLLGLGGEALGTWLAAANKPVGTTPVEADQVARARTLLRRARDQGVEVLFPETVVVAVAGGSTLDKPLSKVASDDRIIDWAESSVQQLSSALQRAPRSMLWGALSELRGSAVAETSSTARVLRAMAKSEGVSLCIGSNVHARLLAADGELPPISLYSPASEPALHFLRGQRLVGLEALVRTG